MTTANLFWNRFNVFVSLVLTLTLSLYAGKFLQIGDGLGAFVMLLVVAPHVFKLRKDNLRLPLVFLAAVLTAAATGYVA